MCVNTSRCCSCRMGEYRHCTFEQPPEGPHHVCAACRYLSQQPPDDPNVPQELKDKTGQRRFCKTCRIHKPPRAHHCRKCGHCVVRLMSVHIEECENQLDNDFPLQLKMDHHCPWIANCEPRISHMHTISILLLSSWYCIRRRILQSGSFHQISALCGLCNVVSSRHAG